MVAALVFFSVVMVAAGLFGLVAGMEIIRLEWGATFFMAGTTSIAGGFITLALAMVLSELRHIRRQGDTVLKEAPPWQASEATLAATSAAAVVSADASSAEVAMPSGQVSATVLPVDTAADTVTEPSLAPPTHAEILERVGASRDADTGDSLPRATLLTAEAATVSEEHASPGGSGQAESMIVSAPEQIVVPAVSQTREATEAPDAEMQTVTEDTTEAVSPEPTPARSFSVGATTYVVFTDGSIEARTPDDVRRFASMDEVRAFLATRH